MPDYEHVQDGFAWTDIFEAADWDAPEERNIAPEVCDRHAESRETVAL